MIYIVRHGQTEMNKAKALQGRSNRPLNDKGREQALEAAARFRAAGIQFDTVYSSPLDRAVERSRLIAGTDDIVTDERLIEMEYGPYEGMDLTAPAPEVMAFFADFANVPAPEGMEQLSSVVARSGAFLEDLRNTAGDRNILIATHAIAMKGLLEYLTPESNGSYWSKYIGNCEVYACEIKNNQITVRKPFDF